MNNSEVSDIRNRIFWVPTISQEMNLRQDELGFSSFYAKFVAKFDEFSYWSHGVCCKTLENHQICQKFGKKMKKSLVHLALNPFFGWFLVTITSLNWNVSFSKHFVQCIYVLYNANCSKWCRKMPAKYHIFSYVWAKNYINGCYILYLDFDLKSWYFIWVFLGQHNVLCRPLDPIVIQ